MMHGDILKSLRSQRGMTYFILAWSTLILVTFFLDVAGFPQRNVIAGPLLNLVTLLIFIGVFVSALKSQGRFYIWTIALVAFIQGVISLLQYSGFDWAWEISNIISGLQPFQNVESVGSEDASLDFENVGRVRGTHRFVHVFNGVQSLLVAICLYMTINSDNQEIPSFILRLSIGVAAIIGALGLLLSFSRSGIAALGIALMISLMIRPRLKKLLIVFAFSLLLIVVLYGVGFGDAKNFGRITANQSDELNVVIRLQQYIYAVNNFLSSPIIGTSGLSNVVELELPIHSVPLRFLNDYGLAGFVLYFVVLIKMVALIHSNLKSGNPQRVFWGGAAICLVMAGLADSWSHSSGFLRKDTVYALLLGLLLGSASGAKVLQKNWLVTQCPPPRGGDLIR